MGMDGQAAGKSQTMLGAGMESTGGMLKAWEVGKSPRFGLKGSLKRIWMMGGVVCGAQRAWKIIPESHEAPAPLILMEY